MKVFLDMIGCRLNQAEIERYAAQFRAQGHEIVGDAAQADCAIINTCSVTAAAASDSRGKVRNAARAGCKKIIVTGCWSDMEPEIARSMPDVVQVVSNQSKDELVSEYLGIPLSEMEAHLPGREALPGAHARTRAFIKVQDGCDNHCTFCVTHLVRGKARSVPFDRVLLDVDAAVRGGVNEIVLTGVNLGAWGLDIGQNLADLIRLLLNETDILRIRLSSLESWNLSEAFISLWKDKRLCPHLHLPLQSGSPSVLKRMARRTTTDAFLQLVNAARTIDPDFAITTDVITGFPGETDREFQETFRFIEQIGFADGHVFPFSARPGTAAARMEGVIDKQVSRARAKSLRDLFARQRSAFYHQCEGKTLSALWETADDLGNGSWLMHGLTGNYLAVQTITDRCVKNEIDTIVFKAGDNSQ